MQILCKCYATLNITKLTMEFRAMQHFLGTLDYIAQGFTVSRM